MQVMTESFTERQDCTKITGQFIPLLIIRVDGMVLEAFNFQDIFHLESPDSIDGFQFQASGPPGACILVICISLGIVITVHPADRETNMVHEGEATYV